MFDVNVDLTKIPRSIVRSNIRSISRSIADTGMRGSWIGKRTLLNGSMDGINKVERDDQPNERNRPFFLFEIKTIRDARWRGVVKENLGCTQMFCSLQSRVE